MFVRSAVVGLAHETGLCARIICVPGYVNYDCVLPQTLAPVTRPMDNSQECNVPSPNDLQTQTGKTMLAMVLQTSQPEAFDNSRLCIDDSSHSLKPAVSVSDNLQARTAGGVLPANVSQPCVTTMCQPNILQGHPDNPPSLLPVSMSQAACTCTSNSLHGHAGDSLATQPCAYDSLQGNTSDASLSQTSKKQPSFISEPHPSTSVSQQSAVKADALCTPLAVEQARPSDSSTMSTEIQEQLNSNNVLINHLIHSQPVILSAFRNRKTVVIEWTFPNETRLFVIKYTIYITSKLAESEFFAPWKSICSVPSLNLPISSVTLFEPNGGAQCIFVVQAIFTNGLRSKISNPVIT